MLERCGMVRLLAAAAVLALHHGAASAASPTVDCDRQCLYGFVDQYLEALMRRDPTKAAWAKDVLFTENNVALEIGDGLWGTVTGIGSYKLKFADVKTGQVGFFGVVQETRESSPYAMRIKVEDRKISEVETAIFRLSDSAPLGEGPHPFANPKFDDKQILNENLAPGERRPRERMISIADGYFDTLQLNDGKLFTEFADTCNRIENGTQTTNNPQLKVISVAKLGCAEQFRLGNYRYDDRLRARRFPLVDEERGLVLASGFIDHAGRLGTYKLTDGTVLESPIRRPHTFYLMELFKIKDGKIHQIEAVFMTVPYHMPSPWDAR
jgi:hypothetical protein